MSNKKLKQGDSIDMHTASKLEEQGIAFNDDSILIEPNSVILTIGHTTMRIPMDLFRKFAEWYLREQEIKD